MKKETYQSADKQSAIVISYDGFCQAYEVELFQGYFMHMGQKHRALKKWCLKPTIEAARAWGRQFI